MDVDNGRDNRVSDFALIRKSSSHVSSLVLTLDGAIPSGHAYRHASFTSLQRISHTETSVNINIRCRHAWQTLILDVIHHVLLLQHPSNLDKVIICKNANLSTSLMEYSSWHLLNRVTVALSTILNLSERRADAVKSGSLCCADEFKQQENKSSDNVRRQANLLS